MEGGTPQQIAAQRARMRAVTAAQVRACYERARETTGVRISIARAAGECMISIDRARRLLGFSDGIGE